jgi:hypothetical protein
LTQGRDQGDAVARQLFGCLPKEAQFKAAAALRQQGFRLAERHPQVDGKGKEDEGDKDQPP